MPAVAPVAVARPQSPQSLYLVSRRVGGGEKLLLIFARSEAEARAAAAFDIGTKQHYTVLSTREIVAGVDEQLGGRLKNLHGLLEYIDPELVDLILKAAIASHQTCAVPESRIRLATEEPDS